MNGILGCAVEKQHQERLIACDLNKNTGIIEPQREFQFDRKNE